MVRLNDTQIRTKQCNEDVNPRGSTYTTIRELGPKIPYYRRNYGPNPLMVIYVDPLGMGSLFRGRGLGNLKP